MPQIPWYQHNKLFSVRQISLVLVKRQVDSQADFSQIYFLWCEILVLIFVFSVISGLLSVFLRRESADQSVCITIAPSSMRSFLISSSFMERWFCLSLIRVLSENWASVSCRKRLGSVLLLTEFWLGSASLSEAFGSSKIFGYLKLISAASLDSFAWQK